MMAKDAAKRTRLNCEARSSQQPPTGQFSHCPDMVSNPQASSRRYALHLVQLWAHVARRRELLEKIDERERYIGQLSEAEEEEPELLECAGRCALDRQESRVAALGRAEWKARVLAQWWWRVRAWRGEGGRGTHP